MSSVPEPNLENGEKTQKVKLVEGQQVSLGCGTLILIALIVLIFGRSGTGDLEREVKQMSSQIRDLETAVKAQTKLIESLKEKLDNKNEDLK